MAKRATASGASAAETSAAKPKATSKKSAEKKSAEKKAVAPKDVVVVKKDATPAKKTVPALLTLTDIGDHLATTFDMPKSHAKIYLAEAVMLIGKSLRKGGKVRVAGLGVFEVKKRAARKGRNPSTGEPMKIKASKRVGFVVARDLKVKL